MFLATSTFACSRGRRAVWSASRSCAGRRTALWATWILSAGRGTTEVDLALQFERRGLATRLALLLGGRRWLARRADDALARLGQVCATPSSSCDYIPAAAPISSSAAEHREALAGGLQQRRLVRAARELDVEAATEAARERTEDPGRVLAVGRRAGCGGRRAGRVGVGAIVGGVVSGCSGRGRLRRLEGLERSTSASCASPWSGLKSLGRPHRQSTPRFPPRRPACRTRGSG